MKTSPVWLALGLVALLGLSGRAAEGQAAKPSPLASLASLVGGRWIGSVPVPAGSPPTVIELRFEWSENQQAIRFDSTFISGEKRKPYTTGLYGWNAAKGKMAIFYVDSGGSLTEGDITQEDGVLVNELQSTEPNGKVTLIRVRLTKVGDNVFTNDIYLQKDGAWVPFVNVRYERK